MQHDVIDPHRLPTRDVYRLMTDLVAPRPIAWVSTQSESGRANLAPYSYFQAVSSNPPTVVLGCGWKRDGTPKDTLRNILEVREFTISHVTESVAEAMNLTSVELDEAGSEWDYAAQHTPLKPAPSHRVRPPRVEGALAALECRLVHAIPLGKSASGRPSSTLVVGEVVSFSVATGLLQRDESGHFKPIDPQRLAAVGRLGGMAYTRTDGTFEMTRPKP